jgi:hypothetical protein
MAPSFHDAMAAGYALTEPALVLGSPLDGSGQLHPAVRVQVALSMLNRHGPIAGATGTGKERQRERMLETGLRSATRIATSKTGQDLIRGVFGTFFGGTK